MIEVNCESDFVARTDDFKELVHDLSHAHRRRRSAVRPQRGRDPARIEREKRHPARRVIAEGKPRKWRDKIVEGRMAKFYEEVCLYQQPSSKRTPCRWKI
jgi:elongation factor Ts